MKTITKQITEVDEGQRKESSINSERKQKKRGILQTK